MLYCAVNKTSTIYIYIHASIETSRKCERRYMYLLTNCINYYMKISPVDMVKGLGQCVCYNADFLCVGVCKQSSCELVIEHPTQGIFSRVICIYLMDVSSYVVGQITLFDFRRPQKYFVKKSM